MDDVLKQIDDFDKDMKSKQLMMESLVVTGQRMSNLLEWFCHEFEDLDEVEKECKEAKELIARWEKEFKTGKEKK